MSQVLAGSPIRVLTSRLKDSAAGKFQSEKLCGSEDVSVSATTSPRQANRTNELRPLASHSLGYARRFP